MKINLRYHYLCSIDLIHHQDFHLANKKISIMMQKRASFLFRLMSVMTQILYENFSHRKLNLFDLQTIFAF